MKRRIFVIICMLAFSCSFSFAQLLEDNDSRETSYISSFGGELVWQNSSGKANQELVLQAYLRASQQSHFAFGFVALSGGIEKSDMMYIGLGSLYCSASEAGLGLLIRGNIGFVQSFQNAIVTEQPIGTGFGAQAGLGYGFRAFESFPIIHISLVQEYYSLEKAYTPRGIQLSVVF